MHLTTRGRYAVAAMLDIALHQRGTPARLADICHRQGISLSYLEQLFAQLRRAGLVASVRGPGGGYLLTRPSDCICVAEVIEAVRECMDATNCGGLGNCQAGATCLTHSLWEDLSNQVHDFLRNISLAQLAQRDAVRSVSRRQDSKALGVRPAGEVAPNNWNQMEYR